MFFIYASNAVANFTKPVETKYKECMKYNEIFYGITKNKDLRSKISDFKKNKSNIIPFDNLSPMDIILSFRELTAIGNYLNKNFYVTINGKKLLCELEPTENQPGNFRILEAGQKYGLTYKDLLQFINEHSQTFDTLIEKLKEFGQKGNDDIYHTEINDLITGFIKKTGKYGPFNAKIKINTDVLSILLYFEIARRLQNSEQEEKQLEYFKKIHQKYINSKKKLGLDKKTNISSKYIQNLDTTDIEVEDITEESFNKYKSRILRYFDVKYFIKCMNEMDKKFKYSNSTKKKELDENPVFVTVDYIKSSTVTKDGFENSINSFIKTPYYRKKAVKETIQNIIQDRQSNLLNKDEVKKTFGYESSSEESN